MLGLSSLEWQIIIMSAIPLTELRLAIPWGIMLGLPVMKTFILAGIGNFLPIIPLLVFLKPLNVFLEKIPFLNKYFVNFLRKTRRKGRKVEKYGALGLFLFVAVPLPGTGVYSGAVLAFILGIRFWYSVFSLTLGMITAGIAVTIASSGAIELAKNIYNFEYLLLGILIIGAIYLLGKKILRKS